MTVKNSRRKRRGATLLEMSMIMLAFLALTLGMFDLGVGVFRYHVLANAARHGARRAVVHGSMANVTGIWGPNQLDVPASANGVPIVDGTQGGIPIGVQPLLIGCNLSQTRIVVDWPDGTNDLEDSVRVTVTSPFQPLLTFILPGTQITLSASSTMQIAH